MGLPLSHECTVSVDGNSLEHFSSLKIEQAINWHHQFEIRMVIADLLAAFGDEEWMDIPLNEQLDACKKCVGKAFSAEFSLTHMDDVKGNTFQGIVTNVSLERSQGSYIDIVLRGYCPTILTSKGKNCRSFEEMTLADIFNKVLNPYSIDTDISPAFSETIPYVVQYKESDFHFLNRLAERYGEWFFFDGETLQLGPPMKGAAIDLYLGDRMPSFNWSLNIEPLQFKHSQYNYLDNEVFEESSKGAGVNGLGDLGDFALNEADKVFNQEPLMPLEFLIADEAGLKRAVEIKRKMQANNLHQFSGVSHHPDLVLGGVFEAKGNMAAFDAEGEEQYGQFLVTQITHFFDGSMRYQNSFSALPVDVEVPPSNPKVQLTKCETQVAVVKENVEDPDGLGRVRVNFGWQEPNDLSPWLRIVTPHAGDNKGMYFIPELEEEVLIGFENGDPDRPFVMGSLYHGKNMPEDFKESKNLIKAIRTQSNNEIQLYDEQGKESILIFNRDNQNEIILTLDEGGKIRIKTDNLLEMVAKDITMSASNDFDITVGNNMTIEVGKNLDVTVGKDKTEKIGGKETVEVAKNRDVTAGKKIIYASGTVTEFSSGTKTIVTAGTKLELASGANTTIEATGNLSVKANGKSSYESMGPMTLETMANSTIKGMMLNLQGQGTATLKATGMVTVKGGVVMIN